MTLKDNACILPKHHPAAPRRESLFHEVSPSVRVHTDAALLLRSSPSIPSPTPQPWHRVTLDTAMTQGASTTLPRGCPHPAVGSPSSLTPPRPPARFLALAPALLWPCAEAVQLTEISRKLIILQIQTWPPAQVPEPAQKRSQDHVAGKGGGEGGGGWDQPHTSSHQCRLLGTSSRYDAAGHLAKGVWTKQWCIPDLTG